MKIPSHGPHDHVAMPGHDQHAGHSVAMFRDRFWISLALAISVAFLFSTAVTLGFPGMPLWEELATLVTIMLLGHWMEMRSVSQAQGALTAGVLASRGIILSPAMGAVLMSLSTVVVALNAQSLRRTTI